jgi:hypothetical protein
MRTIFSPQNKKAAWTNRTAFLFWQEKRLSLYQHGKPEMSPMYICAMRSASTMSTEPFPSPRVLPGNIGILIYRIILFSGSMCKLYYLPATLICAKEVVLLYQTPDCVCSSLTTRSCRMDTIGLDVAAVVACEYGPQIEPIAHRFHGRSHYVLNHWPEDIELCLEPA